MTDKIHLKVFLIPTIDLNELWKKLHVFAGAHLGGETGYYTVVFDGPKADGLEILAVCLKVCETGKFYADFGA